MLIAFHIDNPSGANHGYYRVGHGVDSSGKITGVWDAPVEIPGWFGNENQGGGIAVADLNGDGKPELIIFILDHPSGGNQGFYRIGWSLEPSGLVSGGWSDPIPVPGSGLVWQRESSWRGCRKRSQRRRTPGVDHFPH
jgi:hypothetical protein